MPALHRLDALPLSLPPESCLTHKGAPVTGSMWNQRRVPYCSAGIIFPSLPLGDACGHHLPALLDSEGPSVELFILPGQDQNYLLGE